MLTKNKQLREILKTAQGDGWAFEKRKRHIFGRHPNGQTATISATPSDWRVLRNIQHDLKLR
jgi:predicted RNA binding protein YcfA (HicA-like mRNA interferase family)